MFNEYFKQAYLSKLSKPSHQVVLSFHSIDHIIQLTQHYLTNSVSSDSHFKTRDINIFITNVSIVPFEIARVVISIAETTYK